MLTLLLFMSPSFDLQEILEKYRREGLLRSQGMGDTKSALGPHVYAIADRSYRQMMGEERKSQSILISGESGAGKTESTKIVMLYLTTLGAGHTVMEHGHHDGGNLTIMDRVLQSNPVLEAFGNARTLRNDNSSRFGKFIELGFSRSGHLMGAKVQTYLLEKVRLAFHASGERNYHIFYQLLRGCSDADKKKYRFHDGATHGLELPNYFHYTGQGGAPHLREFTDEDGLSYTTKAMKGLGWSDETVDMVMCIIAGLLHLGQITFDSQENESGQDVAVVTDEKVLTDSAELLGVDVDKLKTTLTERIIVARGQEIKTQLSPEKAVDARDALSKTVYGALFLWVVDQVNQSICWENDADVKSSCGVLDIFGFECFATNSFEQLCINYTNEALQQQFNKFIFKMEQAEYEREKIEWAFIEFPDNQDCLDTIQQNKIGILAMLDDECRLPRGSDKNWANRMYDHFLPDTHQVESENTRFSASFVQKSKSVFCVRHFAGVVEYAAETGFMEKNKDEIPLTAQTLFETAPSKLIKDVYEIQKRETQERSSDSSKAAKSKTVGQQFKEQLSDLMANVEKTDPHYIRCLKPNDSAKPMMLTRKRLTEQLRYGGVLEAVRVARLGYPVRLNHTSFFQRYRMLLPSTPEEKLPWSMEGHEPQKLCVKLVEIVLEEGAKQKDAAGGGKLDPYEEGITRSEKIRRMQHQPRPITFPSTDVQLGLTKVFMRKPPHDALEAHRVFHQNASATIIQSAMRGLQQNRRFLILSHAALTVQRSYRGYKGRERYVLDFLIAPSDLLHQLNILFPLSFKLVDASQSCCWTASYEHVQNADCSSPLRSSPRRNGADAGLVPRPRYAPSFGRDQN
jgi:myosin-5